MPTRTIVFGAASGSGWTSPSSALVVDGVAAVSPPNQSPNTWLALTDGSPRVLPPGSVVTGFRVYVTSLASGGGTPAMAKGFQGINSDAVLSDAYPPASDHTEDASLALDLDDATYYGRAGYGGPLFQVRSVVHDLGAPRQVTRIVAKFGNGQVNDTEARWSCSNDGVNWTNVGFTSELVPFDTDSYVSTDRTLATPTTARYWRFRLRVGSEQGDLPRPRVYEFQLYNGGTLYDGSLTLGVEGLDVALTKDGATVAGSSKTLDLGLSGGTYLLGMTDDLWGGSWSRADVDNAGFGALVRRRTGAGQSDWTERRIDGVTVEVAYTADVGGSLMPREAPIQKSVLGKETTPGTFVSPTILLKSTRIEMQPAESVEEYRFVGETIPGQSVLTTAMAQGSIGGAPTYDEIGYLFRSLFGDPVTTNPSGTVYRHEFNWDPRSNSAFGAWSHEFGDANWCERFVYLVVTGLGLEFSRTSPPSMSGSAIARRMVFRTSAPALTPGANAVQTITISGSPTGGTYALRFKGAVTTGIAHNAANTVVRSALEALATIGSGNVAVTGSGPYTVTFQGALAGVPQPLLELAANNLTGGTSPNVALAMTTLGGYTELLNAPIQPGDVQVRAATTRAGLSGAKLASLFTGGISFDGFYSPVFVLDDALDSFKEMSEADAAVTARLLIEANSAASTFIDASRDQTYRYVQLLSTAKVNIPGSSTPFSLDVTGMFQVTQTGNRGTEQNIVAREFALSNRYDTSWGRSLQVVLTNQVASY